jgi:hypothetical protein
VKKNASDVIASIAGEQLSSIEFVQDYVQLRFDGPTLTAFVWPTLTVGGNSFRFGERAYSLPEVSA